MIDFLPYIMHGILLMFFTDRALMFFLDKHESFASVRVKRAAGQMFIVLALQSLLWFTGFGIGSTGISAFVNLLLVPFVIILLMEMSLYKKVGYRFSALNIIPFFAAFAVYLLLLKWNYDSFAQVFFYTFLAIVLLYSLRFVLILVKQIENYHRDLYDFYSTSEPFSLKWIYPLLAYVLLIYVLFISLRLIWDNYWTQNLYYLLELGFWGLFSHRILYLKAPSKMEDSNILLDEPEELQVNFKQLDKDEFLSLLDTVCNKNKLFLREELTRDDVVREMGTNRTYFSRKLREYTGMNFNTYINDLRLQEAARLLKESDAKIDAVFVQCGFNNKSTFYRTFQEKYNCTPTKFRQGV